jgi:Fe-S-cluster-containing hydrogenase component 2
MSSGYKRAFGNRRGKGRRTHTGLHCRSKLGSNSSGSEPQVFKNLEVITRKIRSTGAAREQMTQDTTQRFQSFPLASMPPAKNPNNVRKISRTVAVVDQRRCAVCRVCDETCAQHAISINENVIIDSYHCNGCGSCVEACPNEAISLVEI